jgi:tRNA uridine 5-carboxymethylaminomethyl modification enzyme
MRRERVWDVIVIGAGHAGCEAALCSARMGCATLMLTMNLDAIGQMSCNPAVGGTAKGHLVREIDALGGEMGRITDLATIQFRVLNASRGPAVRASRAQCDRMRYRAAMKQTIERTSALELRQSQATRLLVEGGRIVGVLDGVGVIYPCRAVVVTAGTFLRGLIHVGLNRQPAGRAGEFASTGLSDSLRELGLGLGRLKTGTSPRLRSSTIDYARLGAQWGDPEPWPFHWAHTGFPLPQVACHITYTTAATHEVIRGNLDRSPCIPA